MYSKKNKLIQKTGNILHYNRYYLLRGENYGDGNLTYFKETINCFSIKTVLSKVSVL